MVVVVVMEEEEGGGFCDVSGREVIGWSLGACKGNHVGLNRRGNRANNDLYLVIIACPVFSQVEACDGK